jgi:hypothetical protein
MMRVREFGNCCGALELFNLSGEKECDMKKAITRYLVRHWLPNYHCFETLPHLIVATTNLNQYYQVAILKKWGFKGKKFRGVHPPTKNVMDLTLWTFMGDIHDFLGPVIWKGLPR